MIPIIQQPAPADFEQKVRKKGLAWLKKKNINVSLAKPPNVKLPDYWTACIPDLRAAYGSICAYVCIYIEEVVGSATVEHFKPKSLYPSLAFEWNNYLLVCGTMNGRKGDFEDVLNPFTLPANTFYLNLVDGEIRPNPNLSNTDTRAALDTIQRLKLNHPECKKLRLCYWQKFAAGTITLTELQEKSPFVYLEAQRQGLL